jgi:hypothetical protein
LPRLDNWLFVDNSGFKYEIIAEGAFGLETISNFEVWNAFKSKYYADKR